MIRLFFHLIFICILTKTLIKTPILYSAQQKFETTQKSQHVNELYDRFSSHFDGLCLNTEFQHKFGENCLAVVFRR